MLKNYKTYFLEIVVFICGAAIMIFELVGSRIVAPYFGTSLFVWTSLIGVILGSLSLGYWLGGKLADKKPNPTVFALLIFLAACSLLLVGYFKDAILLLFEKNFYNLKWGSLLSSLILFTVPSVLLGTISPFAAKLRLQDLNSSGSTIGRLYAISTIGSIFGTFFAGFFLIPFLGSTKIIFLLSFVLFMVSLIIKTAHFFKLKCICLVISLSSYFALAPIKLYFEGQGIIQRDSAYNSITIYPGLDPQTKKPIQVLKINNEFSSSMFLDNDELVFEYTKFYRLGKHFKSNIKNALMLGGAGYSYPKTFLKEHPSSTLDVIEIDPKVTELAYQYFDLFPNERLHIFHEDARVFINKTTKKYDIIYGDAFQSLSPPFQLMTKEAVEKYHSILTTDGVMIVNLISALDGQKGKLLQSEVATFKKVFPHVYIFPVTDAQNKEKVQNIMLVALKTQNEPSFKNPDLTLQTYLNHLATKEIFSKDALVFTDDFAPVEFFVDRALNKN